MPWRLIVIIFIFAAFLVFITFNIDNRCDINLGFTSFSDIPVFFAVFASFTLGLLFSLPLVARFKNDQKKEPLLELKPIKKETPVKSNAQPVDIMSAREKYLARRNGGKNPNGGSNYA